MATIGTAWGDAVWVVASWATGVWSAVPLAALTGTAVDAQIDEQDVNDGGKTIIITLTNDTWKAADTGPIGLTADTQALIDGIDGSDIEAAGWDAEVKANLVPADVTRDSDVKATVVLSAQAGFNISATTTITVTVPAAAIAGAAPITATPTFTVNPTGGGSGVSWIENWRRLLKIR